MHPRIIIPARFDAGRLPGKVLLPIGDKPLLQHVWERGRASGLGCAPLVATDDARVAEAARAFGAEVVMTSAEHRCGSERAAEVARGLADDLIINLQADESLIEPELLARLPAAFEDPAVQMATLAAPLADPAQRDDPSVVKLVVDENEDALYFSRAAIPHFRDGAGQVLGHVGVYAFRREFLIEMYTRPAGRLERAEGLEQLRVLEAGYRIRVLTGAAAQFGVNTPADLERVRSIVRP